MNLRLILLNDRPIASRCSLMRDSSGTPASTATMLVEGYCQDFIQLAASLAQTLEQVSMRQLPLGESRASLERVESGMRNLADAIAGMLQTASPTVPVSRGLGTTHAGVDMAAAGPSSGSAGVSKPTQDGEAKGESIIVGDTSSMPLTSVFQFLSRMRKTGTLRVRLGEEELSFHVADGCIADTRSNCVHPGEVIGDLMVEMGLAQKERIDDARNRHTGTEIELEASLVRAGVVSIAQLRQTLEQLASRRIHRVAKAKRADYTFDEGQQASATDRIRIQLRFKGR